MISWKWAHVKFEKGTTLGPGCQLRGGGPAPPGPPYWSVLQVGMGSLGGTVFPEGTLYTSANYVIFMLVYWWNSVTQKKEYSLLYTDIFFFRLFP